MGGPPDGEIEDVKHGRVPRLLDELGVEIRKHHGGELVKIAVAARKVATADAAPRVLEPPAAWKSREICAFVGVSTASAPLDRPFPIHNVW